MGFMSSKLDKLDNSLLFELDRAARQSYSQIARKLGVSKDVILYRVKRLENLEIVTGYYALIDFSKLGYFIVRVYLRLQYISPDLEADLIRTLVKNPNTLQVYKTDGPWNIAMGILVKSFEEFHSLWERIELSYRRYIMEREVTILSTYIHYYRNYLIDRPNWENTPVVTGTSEKEPLDEKDLFMLHQLAVDGKTPIVKLSKLIRLSVPATVHKLKQLEKNKVILAYRAKIAFEKLGYEYYKVDISLDDVNKRQAIRNYLQLSPNIAYEDITIGGSDLEFDVEVKSYEIFTSLITDLRRKFPGVIRSHRFYKATSIYKYIYLPEKLPKTI
jgi:Lrp/AsnC family transcriptional regulator, leucine-responsive regulatory protein